GEIATGFGAGATDGGGAWIVFVAAIASASARSVSGASASKVAGDEPSTPAAVTALISCAAQFDGDAPAAEATASAASAAGSPAYPKRVRIGKRAATVAALRASHHPRSGQRGFVQTPSATTGFRRTPIPSTSTSTTSPCCSDTFGSRA